MNSVTINRPTTENDKWFLANQKAMNLAIRESNGIYHSGEQLRSGFMFWFTGTASEDLDTCIAKTREYIEGDHE